MNRYYLRYFFGDKNFIKKLFLGGGGSFLFFLMLLVKVIKVRK